MLSVHGIIVDINDNIFNYKKKYILPRKILPLCSVMMSCSPFQVYPYQNTVIQQLAACLDDHKRLVRKEAVDARSKW